MTQNLSDAVTANQDVSKPDSGVRRTRLREFQAQLVERMQAAQRGEFVQVNQLGIMVGQVRYLLELRESGEIVSASSLTTVPLTKDWYVGLANIRGNLTSVVDLPRMFAKPTYQSLVRGTDVSDDALTISPDSRS